MHLTLRGEDVVIHLKAGLVLLTHFLYLLLVQISSFLINVGPQKVPEPVVNFLSGTSKRHPFPNGLTLGIFQIFNTFNTLLLHRFIFHSSHVSKAPPPCPGLILIIIIKKTPSHTSFPPSFFSVPFPHTGFCCLPFSLGQGLILIFIQEIRVECIEMRHWTVVILHGISKQILSFLFTLLIVWSIPHTSQQVILVLECRKISARRGCDRIHTTSSIARYPGVRSIWFSVRHCSRRWGSWVLRHCDGLQ